MTSLRMRTVPLLAIAVLGVFAASVAVEASADTESQAASAPASSAAPTAEPSPEPTPERSLPTEHVGPRMRVALRSAGAWEGTATYRLAHQAGSADVKVIRSGGRWRVDVTANKETSSLFTADAGTVACQAAAKTTCVLAAGPKAKVPAAFDTGIATLMFVTLPGLDRPATGLVEGGWLAAGRDAADQPLAAAACAEVVSPKHVDQYCLTEAGLLVRATLAGGTLTLVTSSDEVDPQAFTPAVTPVPLT